MIAAMVLIHSMKKYNSVFKKMTFQLTPKYFGNGVTLNQNTDFKENCQRNKKRQSLCEIRPMIIVTIVLAAWHNVCQFFV